jgi:hypothetical protein
LPPQLGSIIAVIIENVADAWVRHSVGDVFASNHFSLELFQILQGARQGAPLLEGAMKAIWIVRWRGLEEECLSAQDALDRWDQLDALGIKAEVFEVVAGCRRSLLR